MGWVLPKPAFPSLSARQVGARQLCSDSQKPGFCCQLHPGAAAAASTCLERRLEVHVAHKPGEENTLVLLWILKGQKCSFPC